jgi:hypothetical protein
MVLVQSDDSSATLRAPLRIRPPALVAIAFWLMTPLPLLVPERSGTVHYAFSALLAAVGVALVLGSLRRPASRLEFGPRLFRTDDRTRAIAEARELLLSGASEDTFEPAYRAELVFDNGQRELLLEYSEPARVMRDLAVLLPRLELPVRLGWGLPEGARPWQWRPGSQASTHKAGVLLEPITVESPASARRPALALIIGAIALGALQAILITSALNRESNISPLSLALSLSSVVTVLLIGIIVWSRRIIVTADRQVSIQVRILGIDLVKLGESKAPVRDAWAVSPEGGTPRHVLIATEAGPLSVPCEGNRAATLARELKARATS